MNIAFPAEGFATIDRLREIARTKEGAALVFPDEGEFTKDGFVFNGDHRDFDPLWVDPTTASVVVKVVDSLMPENQDKYAARLAENRAWFARLVEFAWKHTA